MPGVELHAIIIETILNNATIKKFHIPLNISIIVALCILLAYIISQSRSFKLSFASTTIIIVVYILFSFILYAFFNRLTLLAIPVIQLLVAAGLATTSSYFLINKERNTIYDSFKRYVSPEVARIASENIQHLQSTRKDITLLFSDIKGFTSISEELDPNLLSYMLNTYLSKMGDIVFKHQGTLDKYIGDAVMAFWGAPIPVSTPEYKACLTAFEMIEAVNELNKMFTVKGIPELQIRIGINTTRAMVGNLGGKSFNYTAIGDGVNLAARLEGANKNFNSSILISHYTYEKIQDKILCRELGTIQVKGKNEPITVFNPICTTEHKNAQSIKEFISYFDQARKLFYIQHYNEALELFKLCLNLIPDDPVTDSFIDSIKHNLSSDN
jgi:adenylate cyclase